MEKKIPKKKTNPQIIELEKQVAELTSGWQRTQADFLNFKKQTANERVKLINDANEDLILEPGEDRAFIKVKNADLSMAKLLEIFTPASPCFDIDIHPTAVINKTAKIGKNCKIGANSYVGNGVILGDGAILYPNVTIMDDSTIGEGKWPVIGILASVGILSITGARARRRRIFT